QAPAGAVLLEHVATIEVVAPASRIQWDAVVMITGSTLRNLRFRMDRLAQQLEEDGVETTQIPVDIDQLEVRLTREAIMNQLVHFPEVQTAVLPFANRARRIGETTPPVVLRQVPLPLSEARKVEVRSNRTGSRLPITRVADVQIANRPEVMVRLRGGGFAGFVLVRGLAPAE